MEKKEVWTLHNSLINGSIEMYVSYTLFPLDDNTYFRVLMVNRATNEHLLFFAHKLNTLLVKENMQMLWDSHSNLRVANGNFSKSNIKEVICSGRRFNYESE